MVAQTKPGLFSTIKNTLSECKALFKQGGFKAVWKRYGWKIFAAFFIYYLIRDLTLYIVIPYLVVNHFLD